MIEGRMTRVFLVGCPRSGTTVLQSCLAAHPKIITFPESHFFRDFLPVSRPGLLNKLKKPFRVNHLLPKRLDAFLQAIDHPDARSRFPSRKIGRARWARCFTSFLDDLAAAGGVDVWIEKTPAHIRSIPIIHQYVPDALFIHLVRNGCDTVASLYEVTRKYPQEWNGGNWSLESCVERWNEAWRITQQWRGDRRHHVIHFESFVENPSEALSELCRFMGVSFDQSMLSRESVDSGIVVKNEKWKRDALGEIRPPSSKFDKILTVEQQQFVRTHLQE